MKVMERTHALTFRDLDPEVQERLVQRRAEENASWLGSDFDPEDVWYAWLNPDSPFEDYNPQTGTGTIRQRDYLINRKSIRYDLLTCSGGDYLVFEAEVRDLQKLARRVLCPSDYKQLHNWHRRFYWRRGVAKVWDADIDVRVVVEGQRWPRMHVELYVYDWPYLPDDEDAYPGELLERLRESIEADVTKIAFAMRDYATHCTHCLEYEASLERAREELEDGNELYDEDGAVIGYE